jgi:hypothetical protein
MVAAAALEKVVKRAVIMIVLGVCAAWPAAAATRVLVVAGLGGMPKYEESFEKWSAQVAKASASVTGDPALVQRLAGREAGRANIEAALRKAAQELHAGDHFVLVLIGHGSFDGTDYRFNIPGDDITGAQMLELLDHFPEGVTQLVVDATSTSGAIADKWTNPRRVVITATKNGGERNATRFGAYWAEALTNSAADRDKDGNVTAQEAFDYATRKVADSFKADASIVTEHARLTGKDAGRIVVARLGAAALFASDKQLAALRVEQDGIEQRIDAVRKQKGSLKPDDYYARLEPVLLDMARLGERIDARLAELGVDAGGGNDGK